MPAPAIGSVVVLTPDHPAAKRTRVVEYTPSIYEDDLKAAIADPDNARGIRYDDTSKDEKRHAKYILAEVRKAGRHLNVGPRLQTWQADNYIAFRVRTESELSETQAKRAEARDKRDAAAARKAGLSLDEYRAQQEKARADARAKRAAEKAAVK